MLKTLSVLLLTTACLAEAANLLVSVESALKDAYRTEVRPAQKVGAWPPDFCHKLVCPKYSVLSTHGDDFELRLYDPSNWYSTSLAGSSLDQATYTLFERLFKYISGDNVDKEKIEMTAPVLTRIIPGPGPTCGNNFTLSFYDSLASSPKPTDPSVSFSSLPRLKAYVRHFGGFATEKDWVREATTLGEMLSKQNLTFVSDYYYIAGYDSPFKLLNRHNEVWFLAQLGGHCQWQQQPCNNIPARCLDPEMKSSPEAVPYNEIL